jgi:Flp pilus assembly protein TadG
MIARTATTRRRRGAAAVEMAVAATLLSPMLIGMWEVGRVVQVQQILSNAVREGGRQASTGQLTSAQVQQVVTTYLQNAGLPTTNAAVTVQDLSAPGTDPTAASQFDQIQVSATIPYADVRYVSLQLVTKTTPNLTASSTWYSMVDKPYPSPFTPPIE